MNKIPKLEDFHSDNYHLYVEKADPDFSPEKNRDVIKRTLAKNWKARHTLSRKAIEQAGDRADILASYGVYRLSGGGTKKFDDYMGKGWEKRVYSEKLLSKLKIADSVRRLNATKGNTKYLDYYLT